MILMYKIIQGLIGIDMSIFTFRDTLPTPEVINTRFSSIQYTTMLEPISFPAELLTCGITYHQILSKHHL